jgi:MFS family permease
MREAYSKDPRVERSLRHSLRDGIAYAVMTGAGEIYFSAYAIFLKASTAQISFLAAVPSLLGSFAQLFAAWLARRSGRRKAIILAGVLAQAITWLSIIWLPFFFPAGGPAILIVAVVLYYATGSLAAPLWNSLMGDLVPEQKRGRFFAERTRRMSLTSFVSLVLAGGVLHFADLQHATRFGFLLIFNVAIVARFYSLYQLNCMAEPEAVSDATQPVFTRDFLQRLRHSQFARFSVFFAMMSFSVALAAPFFTVYMLRDLRFSYLEFTAATAVSVLAQFMTLSMWGRLSDVFGNRLIMAVTGFFIPVLPLLWLVSTAFWYIVAIQVLGGLSWAGFSLSASNYVYDTVAPAKRARYGAMHSVLSSSGVFAGALLGGSLGALWPAHGEIFGMEVDWPSSLCWLFLISGLARASMAAVFLPRLREVREVRPSPIPSLIYRVTQFHALSGLVFGLFPFGQGRRHKPRAEVRLSTEE